MSNVTSLDLTEDELNLVGATVWAKVVGTPSGSARGSLENKIKRAFKSAFGTDDPTEINKTGVSVNSYVNANDVQKDLNTWRTKRAAETAGAQTFTYHGVERVVKVENIDSERRLLSGVELLRDGQTSNQFKHFKLNEIG